MTKKVKLLIFSITIIVITIITIIIIYIYNKPTDNKKLPSTTLQGVDVPSLADMTDNLIPWSQIKDKLPKGFPEISIDNNSNVSNVVCLYNRTSITWSNYSSKELEKIKSFLEKELKIQFQANSQILTAYNVNLDNACYNISLSNTDANGESLEYVTLGISPVN